MLRTILAIFSIVFSMNARCVPVEETEFYFYFVNGVSVKALRDSIRSNTPITYGKVKFGGSTKWNVLWRYKYAYVHGKCGIERPEVKLKVVYRMPKISASQSSDDVIRSFGKYYDLLLNHEYGHRDNGMRVAIDVEKVMNLMPAQASCIELNRKVKILIKDTIADYSKWDKKYDYDTDHGWRQGIRLQ